MTGSVLRPKLEIIEVISLDVAVAVMATVGDPGSAKILILPARVFISGQIFSQWSSSPFNKSPNELKTYVMSS